MAEEPKQRRATCLAELIAERRITEKLIAKKLLVKSHQEPLTIPLGLAKT